MALRGSARLTGVGASASSQASTYRVSRALCSVCGRCMPVTGAGVLRVHGPLSNRCAGSGMCPSSASSAAATATTTTTTTLTADANGANGQDPTPVSGPFPSESLLQLFRRTSTSVKVVKRIPRASRHFAATKLAHVLDGVTEHNDAASWEGSCSPVRRRRATGRSFGAPSFLPYHPPSRHQANIGIQSILP